MTTSNTPATAKDVNYNNVRFIDLIEKHGGNSSLRNDIYELRLSKEHHKFTIGQRIEFTGGSNNDVRLQSEITGFDSSGNIFVLWDCFWFPIHDDEHRNIVIIDWATQ